MTTNATDVAFYIDTSALVKLVVAEPETDALRSWLKQEGRDIVSCDLTRTELMRAVRKVIPDRAHHVRAVLDSVTMMQVTTAIFESAGRLEPTVLRSLDAIHVASALDLGDDLEAVITYDDRQAAAARSNGLATLAPN